MNALFVHLNQIINVALCEIESDLLSPMLIKRHRRNNLRNALPGQFQVAIPTNFIPGTVVGDFVGIPAPALPYVGGRLHGERPVLFSAPMVRAILDDRKKAYKEAIR